MRRRESLERFSSFNAYGSITGMMANASISLLVCTSMLAFAPLGCNALTGQVRVSDTDAASADSSGSRTGESAAIIEDDRAREAMENAAPTETPCERDEFVSPVGLPTGVVTIGGHVFHVELAVTRESQIRGLMERESLAPDAGMLFVFDEPRFQSFWMLNTPLPLDVAFIREDLTISSIDTMEPLTTTQHASIEPVPYVLEVPAGEFARRGIGPRDVISIAIDD